MPTTKLSVGTSRPPRFTPFIVITLPAAKSGKPPGSFTSVSNVAPVIGRFAASFSTCDRMMLPCVAKTPLEFSVPSSCTDSVAFAAVSAPIGIVRSDTVPGTSSKFWLMPKPWTKKPSCVIRRLSALSVNAPSRVNTFSFSGVRRTKKPSPSIARSLGTPVDSMDPGVNDRWIEPMVEPRPICAGFVPPCTVPGFVPDESVRANCV